MPPSRVASYVFIITLLAKTVSTSATERAHIFSHFLAIEEKREVSRRAPLSDYLCREKYLNMSAILLVINIQYIFLLYWSMYSCCKFLALLQNPSTKTRSQRSENHFWNSSLRSSLYTSQNTYSLNKFLLSVIPVGESKYNLVYKSSN